MRSYRAAAEQGNAGAQSNLGDGYFKGLGLPRHPCKRPAGIERRQSKASHRPRTTWVRSTITAGVSRRTLSRHCTGTAGPPSRDSRPAKTAWA